jgi:perosamine synthetase
MSHKQNLLTNKFLHSLKEVLGGNGEDIFLHEPVFNDREKENLIDCIDSTYVSSIGKYVNIFEEMICNYTGSEYAIAVVNGTAALHVALHLAGVKRNDEVLVPALSFVATANAVAYCGAIPHFVDASMTDLGMDAKALKDYLHNNTEIIDGSLFNKNTQRRISAILPMHTYGHPVDLPSLVTLANEMNIPLIEDAAESLGSWSHNSHTGTLGLMGIFSFNGNKIVTTGGGGVIVTNNRELAIKARHLTTTARIPDSPVFAHDEIGWNYRMPNINAALGCAQMEKLEMLLLNKRNLAERYQAAFNYSSEIKFISEPDNCTSNYWLNTVLIQNESSKCRDDLLKSAQNIGFHCRPSWVLLNKLEMYKHCPAMVLKNSTQLEKSIINLPSSATL